MKRVKLKDIAAELNVTVSTVSHVLNGHDDISESMKKKVKETAQRLGYISDDVAGSLRSGKTKTVALIVPDIANQLLSRQIRLVEEEARRAGYTAVILNTNESFPAEREAIEAACRKRVDGIMLCPVQSGEGNHIEYLRKTGIPFVLFSRFFRDIDTDYVCSDDIKGGYLAASHLLERGFDETLYIGAYGSLECSQDRYLGICRAYEERGLRFPEDRVISADPRGGQGEKLAAQIEGRNIKPDSLIVFSDLMAFDLCYVFLKEGKALDLPIVSFDITHSYMRLPFHHTSVGMTDDSLAPKAFALLLSRMKGFTGPSEHILIDVSLRRF